MHGSTLEYDIFENIYAGRRTLRVVVVVLLLGILLACGREPEAKGPQYGTKPATPGIPAYHLAVH
ncbi:MAG: hypothetical protein WCI73_20265, partial [Phycisphaerae bacterium]